ncbi:MAG: PHP domain-containing protein, partial [Actinomycetota bacterium]|nr:PHP domain-containing protein [Actinomycetota bacterium]
MPFAHLHVASGFSLQYGTATPQAMAARAVELGQPIMGLTDRDGLYGAVRWALACRSAGIGMVLGVDLAMEETAPAARSERSEPRSRGAMGAPAARSERSEPRS